MIFVYCGMFLYIRFCIFRIVFHGKFPFYGQIGIVGREDVLNGFMISQVYFFIGNILVLFHMQYILAQIMIFQCKVYPLYGMSVRYGSCVKLLRVLLQFLDEKSDTNFHFICSGDNLLGYDSRIEICFLRVHFLSV